MRASRSAVNRLVQKTEQAIALFSPHRNLLFMNDAAEKLFGLPLDSFSGLSASYRIPDLQSVGQQDAQGQSGSRQNEVVDVGVDGGSDSDLSANLSAQRKLDAICPPLDCFEFGADCKYQLPGGALEGWPPAGGGAEARRQAAFANAIPISGSNHDESEAGDAGYFVLVVIGLASEADQGRRFGQVAEVDRSSAALRLREFHWDLRQLLVDFANEGGPRHLCLSGSSQSSELARQRVDLACASAVNTMFRGPRGNGACQLARAVHHARQDDTLLLPLDCQMLAAPELQAQLKSGWGAAGSGKLTLLLSNAHLLGSDAQAELLGWLELNASALQVFSIFAADSEYECGIDPRLLAKLSVLTIEIPGLQDRPEDIPVLAQAFLEQSNTNEQIQLAGFTAEAWELLGQYPWAGEVIELQQVVREAAASHRTSQEPAILVGKQHLPEKIRFAVAAEVAARQPAESLDLDAALQQLELELIEQAVASANGNKSKAATMLGISRARLLRRLGSNQPDFIEVNDDE